MIAIKLNNCNLTAYSDISLISALKYAGVSISRFCFHESLPVAGNCRACLVEVESLLDKPVASCVAHAENAMVVWTDSVFAKKARENVMEILLINHPLDCPICDQAGECDLQDQSKAVGSDITRYFFKKRSVSDKNFGFFIKTIMTRCIHCTRCVRFNTSEGKRTLGVVGRGSYSEISTYVDTPIKFGLLGNVIDLCPVGALTGRPYAFQTRPWEFKVKKTLDLTDGLGANIYVNIKDSRVYKILPKRNFFLNGEIITDLARFSYDSSFNNRLMNVYEFNKFVFRFEFSSWQKFLKNLKIKKAQFLINRDTEIKNIISLKRISNAYYSKVDINLVGQKNQISNFYVYKTSALLSDLEKRINFCVLLAANTQTELAILNLKLKLKQKKTILSIFCMGSFFNSSLKINFFSLALNTFFFLCESKLKKSSRNLLLSLNSLIVCSEGFKKRICLNVVKIHLTFFLKKIKVLNLSKSSNAEGSALFNLMRLSKKKCEKQLLCFNLDFTISLSKIFLKKNSEVFWFTAHRPAIFFPFKFIIPITTYLETDGFFINLEQKIQKANKVFDLHVRSLDYFLNKFFYTKIAKFHLSFLQFLFLLVDNDYFFYSLSKKIVVTDYITTALAYKHPIRGVVKNTAISTKWVKNSINIMMMP